MIELTGEYEATLDAKGRFLLPSKIKKDLPEDTNNRFVITVGHEGCLELYPIETWKLKLEEVKNYDLTSHESRFVQRRFLKGMVNLELDSANRLLIPKGLIAYAGMVKDITLSGMIEKIEVWDTKKFNEFFEHFTDKMYSDLTQNIKLKNKS